MVTVTAGNPQERLPRPVRVPSNILCDYAEDPRSELNLFFNEIRAANKPETYETPDNYLAVEELCPVVASGTRLIKFKKTPEIYEAPKKTPEKAGKAPASNKSSTTASGNTTATATSPASQSGASASGTGAGAGGGRPPGGGSGSGKKVPDDGSPAPRRRKSRRLNPGLTEEDDPTTLATVSASPNEENQTLATVGPAPKRARKKATATSPAPPSTGSPPAPAAVAGGSAPAPGTSAGTPGTPSGSLAVPTSGAAPAAATETPPTAAATATPPAPTVIPMYTCGPQCRCNQYNRTELREQLACNPTEHCRENLSYLRYLSLKHELTEIKNELKDTRQQVTNVELESKDILQASQEAADVRASENEALDDEDKLELKWETMDDGAEIFGEAEKKKALFRVLRKLPQELTHFPRSVMRALFTKSLQEKVYPEEKPKTHSHVPHIFILGERYHVLPQILHDFICNYMAKHVVGAPTFEKAKEKLEKYFNERRKQAKIKQKNKFIGKLADPVHLLVWRDTWSKAYLIQEEPPFRGSDASKQAFMDKWQDSVDSRIAFKHPNGFTHPEPE